MDKQVNKVINTTLIGTTNRALEADANGLETASKDIVIGKLTNATTIALLVNAANWSINGVYTGTAITGTFEGMYYSNDDYDFWVYSDNVWHRKERKAVAIIIGTLTLISIGGKAALFHDSATGDQGLATLETAGEALAKGEVLVCLIGGTSGKLTKCPTAGVSHSTPVGVALTSAAADGNTFWMAGSGSKVQVLPEAGITAAFGNILTTSPNTAGTVEQDANVPTTKHWDEVGHWAANGTGNGALTLAFIHFN